MRNLLLSSVTLLLVPAVNIAASDFSSHTHTHTHTTPIELKPISLSSGTKLAGICFLGTGDCDPGIGFGSGEGDYQIDAGQQCLDAGYVNSCSSGYCLDSSCPYDSSYGKCQQEICPSGSSTSCNGDVIGQTACGIDCKKCCDDACPSGYAKSTSAECYDTQTTECGTTCYKEKDCSSCPGYYECGGTWQYCEGSVCSEDSSKCSTYCESDHFPYSCGSDYGPCYGDYRDGYCSVECEELETEDDSCDGVSCGSNAYCSDGSCYCNSGYEGDADTGCTPVVTDPCADVSCGSNAYCSNGSCYCNSGYEGNADTGCTPVVTDPCADVSCGSNAYCSNGSCYCNSGYEGNANSGCTEIHTHSYTCPEGYSLTNSWGSEARTTTGNCSCGETTTCYKAPRVKVTGQRILVPSDNVCCGHLSNSGYTVYWNCDGYCVVDGVRYPYTGLKACIMKGAGYTTEEGCLQNMADECRPYPDPDRIIDWGSCEVYID